MTDVPEVSLDRADGQTLVGVNAEGVSAAASIEAEADPEQIEAAVRDLWQEVRHSARLSGGREP